MLNYKIQKGLYMSFVNNNIPLKISWKSAGVGILLPNLLELNKLFINSL